MTLDKRTIDGKQVVFAGHAAIPGTGPKGETCGSCKNRVAKLCSRTIFKCGLNRAKWTSGRKSDVLARDPACSKWEDRDAGKD